MSVHKCMQAYTHARMLACLPHVHLAAPWRSAPTFVVHADSHAHSQAIPKSVHVLIRLHTRPNRLWPADKTEKSVPARAHGGTCASRARPCEPSLLTIPFSRKGTKNRRGRAPAAARRSARSEICGSARISACVRKHPDQQPHLTRFTCSRFRSRPQRP